MSTKSDLLALLQARQGELLSGQAAADGLGVSRAAVWKAAQALRAQGIAIVAEPGGGYRLAGQSDVLSEETLRAALPAGSPPFRYFAETDSTNLEGKRWAIDGAPHGALAVAERQTAGRGRLGRGFVSPPGGMYLSIVLRPPAGFLSAGLVTASVAVAACRAVRQLCGIELGIKWVNDLYLNGKKCCGILTEAATAAETGDIEYLVAGIGINVTTPDAAFPPEVAAVATALYPNGGAPTIRAALAAAVHAQVLGLFGTLPGTAFLQEYRARSVVLGRTVTVLAQPPYQARALGIDDEARLLVRRLEGGEETVLSYGEISVKLR